MGILRGYDVYLNIVLDEALEEKANGDKTRIGMVVIRGNSVVMLEVCSLTRVLAHLGVLTAFQALDRIHHEEPRPGR